MTMEIIIIMMMMMMMNIMMNMMMTMMILSRFLHPKGPQTGLAPERANNL